MILDTLAVILLLAATLGLSWLGTGIVRRFAIKRRILDVPNARSSHEVPTPRGGGIVFSVLFLLAAAGFLIASLPHPNLWIALLGGGIVVVSVGWLDDCRGLPSFVRLSLYAVAAAWAAGWIGGFPDLQLGFASIHLGWLGYLISWAFILAFTNIYNFMDGIDGLTGSEGAIVSLAAGILLLFSGEPSVGWLFIGLSVALLGFLRWNWHPARIFMGDVGSNFLGFVFATAALTTGQLSSVSIWVWAILLGVFIVDGFLTFGRRLMRRLPPYEAHRSHAYQGAVQRGYTHAQVSLAIVGINLILVGVATAAWLWPSGAVALVLLSYALLTVLHLRYSPLRGPRTVGSEW
ncbi:glycosyltransferase family 4 protein [Candidatus Bipolaricaulota bacterium]|nr:glycosyltransferase family 4 protein [Candidatus Bipolaricaulota bacterium]